MNRGQILPMRHAEKHRLRLFVRGRLFRRPADQQGNTTPVLTNQIKSFQQRALGSSLSARLQSAGSPSPDANVGAFLFSTRAARSPILAQRTYK
jgi:hypothetical protein